MTRKDNQLKLFEKIKDFFFISHDKQQQWMDDLNKLGFDKIAFPILIKDGNDLNLVYLDEFASDPDLHYWEFGSNYELIDSNGALWTWKYDYVNESNLPGTFVKTITLDEVRKIVAAYFRNSKVQPEVEVLILEAITIFDLFEKLENRF